MASDGRMRILHDTSLIVRLGEGVDATGEIGPEGMRRALAALCALVQQARAMGAARTRLVATSAVRDARNRGSFISRVQADCGLTVETISGEEESRLSYSSVALDPALGLFEGEQVTVDVGGGSTEITAGAREQVRSAISVRIGAVRLHERYLRADPPSAASIDEAAGSAEEVLWAAAPKVGKVRVVGIGGSAVNLARILSRIPPERTAEVHGAALAGEDLSRMIDMLAILTVEKRRRLVGLDPERADTILAGAIILDRALAVFGSDEMTVSTRGLRHGLLYEMLERGA